MSCYGGDVPVEDWQFDHDLEGSFAEDLEALPAKEQAAIVERLADGQAPSTST